MRSFMLAFAVLMLGACATEANFKKQMDDMKGRTEAELIARLGPPQLITVAPNGVRILTYTKTESATPAVAPPPPATRLTGGIYGGSSGIMFQPSATYSQVQNPADAQVLSCTSSFSIVDGRVATWQSKGNNCVAQ